MSNTWDTINNPERFVDDKPTATEKINDNFNIIKTSFDEINTKTEQNYNPNELINGDFQVWQRGIAFNNITTIQYVADRFRIDPSGSGDVNVSKQICTGDEIDITGSKHFLRLETNTPAGYIRLESLFNLEENANKPLTLSFYAKVQSGALSNLQVDLVRNYGSGGSSENSTTYNLDKDITTTWQKFTITIPAFSLSTKTIGANPYAYFRFINRQVEQWNLDITTIKLEYGSIATPFVSRKYEEELRDCKYYFERITAGSIGHAFGESTTSATGLLQFKDKRVTPSISISDQAGLALLKDGASPVSTAVGFSSIKNNNAILSITTAGDVVANAPSIISLNTDEYIDIDAEI